jgi:hypothetical protein
MSQEAKAVDCYTAIQNLDEAMRGVIPEGAEYFTLGGIVSGALRHPDTRFDHDVLATYAAPDSPEGVLRDNGTRRDVDLLVSAVLTKKEAEAIKEEVARAIDDALVVSVFGLDRYKPKANRLRRTIAVPKSWTSRRTIDDGGVNRYELFPLSQEVPAETYEPWSLVLPSGAKVSTLSPAGHVEAYSMRSISGLRPKDAKKVAAMRGRVESDEIFSEQMHEGMFKPWEEFAQGIRDLRDGLMFEDDSMLRDGTSWIDMYAFGVKGRGLKTAESKDTIVDFAQKEWVQKILNVFVGAK